MGTIDPKKAQSEWAKGEQEFWDQVYIAALRHELQEENPLNVENRASFAREHADVAVQERRAAAEKRMQKQVERMREGIQATLDRMGGGNR
jgi:hypothetical protein